MVIDKIPYKVRNILFFVVVVKRKPLFNDKPTEIQELSYIIKEDLKGINEQLARLQSISKTQSITHQKNGHRHLLSHSNSVVVSLQSKLANMSNEFKHVLDTRNHVRNCILSLKRRRWTSGVECGSQIKFHCRKPEKF